MPNLVGPTLGKLKFEYEIEKAYFISNKTYFLKLKNGKIIIRAKGVKGDSLSEEDFEKMYYKSKNVFGTKVSSVANLSQGSVLISKNKTKLDWNSYKKRKKIYDPITKLWIDTKPLYINNLDKNICLYIPLNIIKSQNT